MKPIELRELSSKIVERLASDEAFRTQFEQNPINALKGAGVPEEYLPGPEFGEIYTKRVSEIADRLSSSVDSGQGVMESLIVACVVI